ncbi:hypothetical protein ACFQ21_17050 [Ohtaekwangia kribbensis]|jgi:hypothetical protein|uniref:Uncharacterized protein n=1 Tax=Ohtaekwangia kribbensis TaxID=688913 RepID=A0ABW3K7R3_9BACT
MRIYFTLLFFFVLTSVYGQNTPADTLRNIEEFKKELLSLRADVANIQVNLARSEKRFKRGIAVATLGYSVTIAGGLMLGRKRDELGKGLLIAGGVTGVTGTILMVDAFKFLGRASRKRSP